MKEEKVEEQAKMKWKIRDKHKGIRLKCARVQTEMYLETFDICSGLSD